MEKCSSINHKEIEALLFCNDCKLYMCNKCEKHHSELFQEKNHNLIKLEKGKDITEIFTGFCNEKNHKLGLQYFCKKHNILCCGQCVIKIKGKENGQHSDCDICFIEDIENEKRNNLKDNIKCLEDISINIEQKINKIKIISEKIDKSKEDLLTSIQNIFTKLRTTLNEREDELLLEVNNKFNELYINENIIKECDKLPNKIKKSLEKGKQIENNWNNNNNLSLLIKNCINIEENINNIKLLNENIEKINDLKINIKFFPQEEGINKLLDSIKNFGDIRTKKFASKIELDEKLVESWLNNREFKSELLYRKSRDGSTPVDFHIRCDNKGITITFIETTNGYKFGGYTELPWDQSNSNKKDKSTFIFSFNNKQKYTARNNNDSIGCYSTNGPRFGCGWPEIYFYNTLDKGQTYDHESCTFLRNKLLTNGKQNFDVKELEVYKIIYLD